MDNLTFDDKQFVISSLNETYHNATKKLEGNNLGDVERAMLKQTADKAKELILKMAM